MGRGRHTKKNRGGGEGVRSVKGKVINDSVGNLATRAWDGSGWGKKGVWLMKTSSQKRHWKTNGKRRNKKKGK